MKRTVLLRVIFSITLMVPVLFNGCDTTQNTAPGGLEGEWEGTSVLNDPVSLIIDENMITMKSLETKSRGTYEVKDETIIYKPTQVYDKDGEWVKVETYLENTKRESLDLLEELRKAGEITQEQYDSLAAIMDNAYPPTETIPYKLEGNKLTLTLMSIGDVVLTRR